MWVWFDAQVTARRAHEVQMGHRNVPVAYQRSLLLWSRNLTKIKHKKDVRHLLFAPLPPYDPHYDWNAKGR